MNKRLCITEPREPGDIVDVEHRARLWPCDLGCATDFRTTQGAIRDFR